MPTTPGRCCSTRKWRSGTPAPIDPSVEEARDWLVRSAQWSESYVGWSVHDSEDAGRYAGSAFLFHIDQEQRAGSVAYRTAPWARGRGAATSAVVAMTGFGFDVLELERLSLPHAVGNAASCRVADKAGFVLEGTEVGGYRDEHGVRWDSHVHGLLRRVSSVGRQPEVGALAGLVCRAKWASSESIQASHRSSTCSPSRATPRRIRSARSASTQTSTVL